MTCHAAVNGRPQSGENPELRCLFYKITHLLQFPIIPIFVFDGKERPLIKRRVNVVKKPHWMTMRLQQMLDLLGIQYYTATGEAEAELAYLNAIGAIDAVITEDSDALLFGATQVIRSYNARAESIDLYDAASIASDVSLRLTRGGMILVGLLNGNDYDPVGVKDIGISIACGLARAGHGDSLLAAALTHSLPDLTNFLITWRGQLRQELRTNSSGCLAHSFPSLADRIPETFPNVHLLLTFARPPNSGLNVVNAISLEPNIPNITDLAKYCEVRFGWDRSVGNTGAAHKFHARLWDGVCMRMLCQQAILATTSIQDPPCQFDLRKTFYLIKSSKIIEGTGIKLYHVFYCTLPFVMALLAGKDADSQAIPECERLMWVPASVLQAALPDLVAQYQEQDNTTSPTHHPANMSANDITGLGDVGGTSDSGSELATVRPTAIEVIDLTIDSDDDGPFKPVKTMPVVIDLTVDDSDGAECSSKHAFAQDVIDLVGEED